MYYANKIAEEKWSVRETQKQIERKAFERTEIAKLQIMHDDSDNIGENPIFKDPYFLDFLGLKDGYMEKDLESAIIKELENFILELGKGFTFVERQKRIILDGKDFYLDLLFFHRKLKRLVAIELKLRDFKPADKGQMELYLKWLDRYDRQEDENSPIGLILCAGKSTEQIELLQMHKDGIMVAIQVGDDLYKLSNEREIYAEGYIIEEIDASNNCISLSNGNILYKGDSQGGLTDEVMKFQIRKTVEEHLKKELRLNAKGIKVLSLFFIDRVANYRQYDEAGNPDHGKFARWFEEIYQKFVSKPAFKSLDKFPVGQIHNGYFSQDKKGKMKDTSGETQADDDTYNLIMKEKEKLLDIENPLRFIFSHSALREGWDNPNVFQICTLNETKSEIKKRQEIGRGLRLAVDHDGKRIYDQNINRLTVIANEAYDDFAKALQKEIEEDCGVEFKGRIKNKRERTEIKYRKGFEADPKFLEIWEKIKKKTTYRVDYATNDLIVVASKAIKGITDIKAPSIRSTKVSVTMTDEGIGTSYVGDKIESFESYSWKIPDVLGYIQSKTELTRSYSGNSK
jgi:type III restriction enzyme